MGFGSVRFFKRLIVGSILVILLTSVLLSVFFASRYLSGSRRMSQMTNELELLSNELLQERLSSFTSLSSGKEQGHASYADPMSYQNLYPDMYVDAPDEYTITENVCYLTFDDGPSAVTSRNLDLLKEKGVCATFFVTGKNSEQNPEIIKRIVDEGHTLGVHTYSHNYRQIYASVDAFLDDFYKMWSYLYETTGEKPTVFRFPGGSINAYNRVIYQNIAAEMLRRGFTYYDWNVASGDAAKGVSAAQILAGATASLSKHDEPIVLMHDRVDNQATASVLGKIIDDIAAAGYTFGRLTNSVAPVTFAYTN